MPKYLVLIYGDEQRWAAAPEEWQQSNAGRHAAFMAAAGAAVLGANELAPAARAVSIRAGSGRRPSVTDGPFMDTKEVIGGYYLLEAADLDEAIGLAGQIPEATATHGGVEVRLIAGSA
jgi:hypothetical protein